MYTDYIRVCDTLIRSTQKCDNIIYEFYVCNVDENCLLRSPCERLLNMSSIFVKEVIQVKLTSLSLYISTVNLCFNTGCNVR